MATFLEQIWIDAWKRTTLFPYEAAVLALLFLFFAAAGFRTSWLGSWVQRYKRLASRRRLSVGIVFLLALLGHFAVEPHYIVPPPGINDEFSHLLAADTFSSGRLTNPPHPMRLFFESMHILVEPTYMSMYQPGQGMLLAIGQILTGNAIAGVWLGAALCCAAVCWMLQAWAPPHWALTGGLLCVLRIGWFSYWANSYWGGALAAPGGALLLGAVPRLIRRPTVLYGALFSVGILILVNTRLLEGAAVSIAAAGWLAKKYFTTPFRVRLSFGTATTAITVLLAGAVLMGYYNWRVTGNPLWPPQLENRGRYEVYRNFVWQQPVSTRTFNHEVIRKFYTETEAYPALYPYWRVQLEKPVYIWFFFVGPALTLPILISLGSVLNPRLRLIWVALAAFFLVNLLVPWRLQPHYFAPLTGAVYILIIEGLRRMAMWQRGFRHLGLQLSRAAVATCLLMIVVRVAAPAMNLPVFQEQTMPWYSYGLGANFHRAKIEDRLTTLGGKHLILVQYLPSHFPDGEWVYNRADIDASAVVWARHVSDRAQLQQLLDYYRDRRVWIVFPDQRPNQIYDFKEHYR